MSQTFTFCPGVQIANFGSDGSGSLLKSVGTLSASMEPVLKMVEEFLKIYFGTTATES